MYILKKMIGFLVTPLIFCSLLQIMGLWMIHRGRKRWGYGCCLAGLGLLMVLSTPAVGERLMGLLENHQDASLTAQPSTLQPEAAFVVVLSGGFHDSREYSPATRLGPDSLRRLLDGMALAKRLPAARLLISGGVLLGADQPAEVMAELAVSLGWDEATILVESEGKTTAEQAQRIKVLVGDAAFYLVTSANHMPRAMEHFESEGLAPIPYPCDHIVQTPTLGARSLVPSIYGLALSNAAIHEIVGRMYGWLFG